MSLYRTIDSHVKLLQNKLYTSLPAVVVEFDAEECTVKVQPSISEIDIDGVVRLPDQLDRVPLLFPNVSDSAITFPVKKGDKVLLHFCQSNFENFITQPKDNFKDIVRPRTLRKHSVNDAFATIGVRTYDDTPVKRPDTFDIYYKDTRMTISDNGDVVLELLKTDGAEENPQEIHKQYFTFTQDGTTNLVYEKDDIKTEIKIDPDGKLSIVNNKNNSNFVMEANGDISAVTNSKFSMDNGTIELIALLSDLINTLANTTVNTTYGLSPLNSKSQLQTLKSQLDTMKA